jgi:hypothetical protein
LSYRTEDDVGLWHFLLVGEVSKSQPRDGNVTSVILAYLRRTEQNRLHYVH